MDKLWKVGDKVQVGDRHGKITKIILQVSQSDPPNRYVIDFEDGFWAHCHADELVPAFKSQQDELSKELEKIQNSGGIKHDSGKPPISMLTKEFLTGVAQVHGYGAKKYGRNNFKAGMEWTRVIDAAFRHLISFSNKQDLDDESQLNHLYHVGACINMLAYYYENKIGKDDR